MSEPASCNLLDPLVFHEIKRLPYEITLQAYLLALAAYQRGLAVTFHYDLSARHERFANLSVQGFRGELFSVSDGSTTRHFRRSMADTVSREVSATIDHKHATKLRLHAAGIAVPPGVLISTGQEPEIAQLLQQYAGHEFLLKPLAGSLAEGVVRQIPADRVAAEISRIAGKPHLLEVYLRGREYRVYVVGDEVACAYERVPAHVVGNGRDTIETLVARKNEQRAQHLLYHAYPIVLDEKTLGLLQARQQHITDVPPDKALVMLSDIPAYRDGGQLFERHATAQMRKTAVAAAQALGIAVVGLDVIVRNQGQPDEQVFVLELNQCPYLSVALGDCPLGSRPAFNHLSEKIIDHYFPASVNAPRHPQAAFDMASVVSLLGSCAVRDVQMPVLERGWVHVRKQLSADRAAEINLEALRFKARCRGLHVRFIRKSEDALWVDFVAPAQKAAWFASLLETSDAVSAAAGADNRKRP